MTVTIYQKTENGMLRVGTYTVRGKHSYSVRAIADKFLSQHPNFAPDELYIAKRLNLSGRWVDDTPLKAIA